MRRYGAMLTTAWLIEELQRPALVLEPNKTRRAQPAAEFRELLPATPSSTLSPTRLLPARSLRPQTDTFIEKDSLINDEVERLRHAPRTRFDTHAVVVSVSCIYGLGNL